MRSTDTQVFKKNAGEMVCVEWQEEMGAWRQSFRPPFAIVWTEQSFNDVGATALADHFLIVGRPAADDMMRMPPEALLQMGNKPVDA